MRVMVNYGFRAMGLHRIQLKGWPYNPVAIRTYEMAGFLIEGRRRSAI